MANKRPSGVGGKSDRTVPITAICRTGTAEGIMYRILGPRETPQESDEVVLEARMKSLFVFLSRGFQPEKARAKAKLDDATWQTLLQVPGFADNVEIEYQRGLSSLMEQSGEHCKTSPTFMQFWLKTQHPDAFQEAEEDPNAVGQVSIDL